ncbi:endolytic transglycosylase MltG [Aurantimonas sp. MSK8Z-1]|nr:endolytic transglycosylase MltG [Aurantimonas sp. MSK8Z-1]MCW4114157.1 endolytic transglycosylase MltG [Aurantimonas sp. MSK8Z-1]
MTDPETDDDRSQHRMAPQSAREALRPKAVPQPTRRSRSARSFVIVFINFLFTLAFVAVLGAGAVAYWSKSTFEGRGPLTAETTYLVPKSAGLQSIAAGLESAGIVSNSWIFTKGVQLAGAASDLKAGEYGFQPGVSMREVMDTIRSGNSILHSVTIPEGWTVKQVFDRLSSEETLTGNLPAMPSEGSLRPETYKFTRGLSRADLVAQMKSAQASLVDEIWKQRAPDLPLKDENQFVTLASIVEKETGVPEERPHVASVFINRLRKGMRLQSDPTIIYGIWGGDGKPADEPIRQSHIKSDTPYNTYVIKGLPPGPIANPGRAALEAVAKPMKSDDIYFVADGSGGHAFSASLDEHNANVRRLRQRERQDDAGAADDAAPAQ